jgi:uncharacterized membrane protein YedE/YeeE
VTTMMRRPGGTRAGGKRMIGDITSLHESTMTIDWANFTPGGSLIGGLLIGFAAAFLVITLGRVAGISGILGGLLPRGGAAAGDRGWRIAFLLGLLAAPGLAAVSGVAVPIPVAPVDWPWLVAAGLLVGVGTRVGAGCTSGHGVCGLSRGSLRSLVATLTFMGTGIATVWVLEHGLRVMP